jgi:hypothetical protein
MKKGEFDYQYQSNREAAKEVQENLFTLEPKIEEMIKE